MVRKNNNTGARERMRMRERECRGCRGCEGKITPLSFQRQWIQKGKLRKALPGEQGARGDVTPPEMRWSVFKSGDGTSSFTFSLCNMHGSSGLLRFAQDSTEARSEMGIPGMSALRRRRKEAAKNDAGSLNSNFILIPQGAQ